MAVTSHHAYRRNGAAVPCAVCKTAYESFILKETAFEG